MNATTQLCIFLVFLAAGCTHSSGSRYNAAGTSANTVKSEPLPGYLQDPTMFPHPQCPAATHLAAVGIGTTSYRAPQNAKGELIKQISSTIRSKTRMMITSRSGTADTEDLQHELDTDAVFHHGELITTVGRVIPHQGSYYGLACLNRSRAISAIEQDLQANLAAFNEASNAANQSIEKLIALSSSHDNFLNRSLKIAQRLRFQSALVANYSFAAQTFRQLLPLFGQYRGLAHRPNPHEMRTILTMSQVRTGVIAHVELGSLVTLGFESWLDGVYPQF